MSRYVATYNQFNDNGDRADGYFYIWVEDTLNLGSDGYFFTSHPEESIKKNLGIDYLAICKKYPSAYREHEKYSCVFVKDESDAKKIVIELQEALDALYA